MAIDLVATLRLQDNLSGPLAMIDNKMMGMVGFAAVTAGATTAVKKFADFDTSMRKAATIAGATDAEFEAMSSAAKELGASTSLSATQVSAAMGEMAAKGYSATQVIDAMPGVIAAAEASGEDLSLVADTVSTALNVWSMEASESSKVADILAMTANKTAAGIGDMQYALKYAGAPAKALGMSLEEVSAAAGLMVNAGLDGSSAGTALRQGLSQLVGPTDKAAKMLDALGFSAVDSNGKVKSMAGIVTSLEDAMKGMSEAEKVTFMKSAVGTESMSAFLALVDAGPEKLKTLQSSLEDSGGSAEEAAEKMKAGIGGALEQASGAIETFAIEVGDALAPMVVKFAEFIANADTQPIIDSLQSLGETASTVASFIIDNFTTIKNVVSLAVYAFLAFKSVGVIVGVINGVIAVVNVGITVFRAAKTAITVAKVAFDLLKLSMLMFPGAWIVAAIGLVVVAGVGLYKNWDKVKATAKNLWNQIKEGKGAIFLVLGPIGQLIKTAITIAKEWDSTKSVWENVWNGMKSSAEDTVNSVISGVNKMIDVINKLPGVNIPIVASVNWTNDVPAANSAANAAGSVSNSSVAGPVMMANKGGWNEIRNNQTPRLLHAGERVLTAVENDNYSKMMTHDMSAAFASVQAVGNMISPRSIVSGQNDAGNPTDFSAGAKRITASIMALDKGPQQVFKDNSSEGVSDYVQQWLLNRDKSAANFATAAPAANVTVNQNSANLDVTGALATMQSRFTDTLSALSIPDGTRDANIVSGAVPFEMPQLDASNARLVERSAVTTTNNYNTYNSEAAAKQESKAPEQHINFEINNPVIREEQDLDDLMTRIADAIKDFY